MGRTIRLIIGRLCLMVLALSLGITWAAAQETPTNEAIFEFPAGSAGIGSVEFEFIVPENVIEITIEIWAAGGGGGGSTSCVTSLENGGGGGAGGYSASTFSVSPGDSFRLEIGEGGNGGNPGQFIGDPGQAGENGIRSRAIDPAGFIILTANGGGGGGSSLCFIDDGDAGIGGVGGTGETQNGGNGSGFVGGAGFGGFGNGGEGGISGDRMGKPGMNGRARVTWSEEEVRVAAAASTTELRAGESFDINLQLINPLFAPNGGVDALEADCRFSPTGMLVGQSVNESTDAFGPDPVVLNFDFQGNNVLYAVSQSGPNPPLSYQGARTVFSMTVAAVQQGVVNLTCDIKLIDGAENAFTIDPVTLELTIGDPPPTTGNITGVVHRSHALDDGIGVRILNGEGQILRTVFTAADGSFNLAGVDPGDYIIEAVTPGYLPAQGEITVVAAEMLTMQEVTLLAGELTGDGTLVIDELDVVQLSLNYGQTVPPGDLAADLNLDHVVGLADLNALAENLRETGPIPWDAEPPVLEPA